MLMSPMEGLEFEGVLYHCEVRRVLANNFGILIYYKGQLVNRLDTPFGDLFK